MRTSAGDAVEPPPFTRVPDNPSDAVLIDAVSHGSVPAFVALFDRTSPAVSAEVAGLLPGTGQRCEVLAASYLEVWWLAGCHTEPGIDVVEWVKAIARRRIADIHISAEWDGVRPRPSYAQLELAGLLRRPVDDLLRS
ncbi:hypothetical protein AB0F81_04790 [Actinoplanes sp. NPDC024001]|uniref:hypothetical protein n=1 Tax=Actinoplanes sp. NPDC024001 TaxID=3154598 RepID=UPI0033DDA37D